MTQAEHRPRKRFGQNFLIDESIISNIILSIAPQRHDLMVEIGPGQGALTTPLQRQLDHLHVVEIDRDLAAQLRSSAACVAGSLSVYEADALQFDFSSLSNVASAADQATEPTGLRVVGNPPYNISSPLLFHLLPMGTNIRDMHFMLQREVVQRLAANPGSKTYGRLSVMVQACCDVEALIDVPSSAFHPAPKVDSAVVRLTPRPVSSSDAQASTQLGLVVKAAFAQRRKTLRNSLGKLIDASALESLGIDPTLRAEMLSVDDFQKIAKHLL